MVYLGRPFTCARRLAIAPMATAKHRTARLNRARFALGVRADGVALCMRSDAITAPRARLWSRRRPSYAERMLPQVPQRRGAGGEFGIPYTGLGSNHPMKFRQLALCAAAMTLCVSGIRAADQPSGPAGHWEGAIQGVKTPQGPQDVPLTLDLARAADGNWTGSVDVGERVKGLQLTDITVNGPSVHMAVKDAPGGASFDGKLSPDGKTMSGDASQGPNSNTFKLTRTGEAHVAEAPRSSVISAQLEGQWKGQLEGPGQTLHLLLDIK